MQITRRTNPSDLINDEWAFLLPYLLPGRAVAGQHQHALRGQRHNPLYVLIRQFFSAGLVAKRYFGF